MVAADCCLGALFAAGGIAVLGEGIFTVVLVPFVKLVGGGAAALGWLLTIRDLGGLCGGLVS